MPIIFVLHEKFNVNLAEIYFRGTWNDDKLFLLEVGIMSEISILGNTLIKYFKLLPEYAEKFNMGVLESYIEEVLDTNINKLPEDFSSLYQWHNGYSEFGGYPGLNFQDYAPFHFNTVEIIAVEQKWDWCDDNPPNYEGYHILPFTSGDSLFWGIVLDQDYINTPHVVYIDETGETILRYDSITTMMKTLVESFSSNALFLSQGKIIKNNQLFSQFAKQNNPKTWYKATKCFDENILIYGSDECDSEAYSIQCSLLWNALQTLKYMKTEEITLKCQHKLAQLEYSHSQRAIDAYAGLNRWLNSAAA